MMATKSKDSATNTNVGKKEKVGTTASNPQTKTNLTRPTTSSSSLKTSSSSSSTTSSAEKQVPNYLKPTISSRHDSAPVGPKPAINRRRSFDNKPPPSSRAPPKTPPTGQQPARSSSFTKGSSRAPLRGAGTGTGTGAGTKPSSQPILYVKSAKKGSGEVFIRKEGPSARAENKVSCEPRKVVDGHVDQVVKIEDDKDRDQTEVDAKSIDHDDAPAFVSEELEPKSESDHDHDHENNHNQDHDHDREHHDIGDNVVVVVEETRDENKLESIEDIVVKEDEEKHGDRSESHESGDHQEISLNNCNDSIAASEDEPNSVEESVKVEEDIKEEVKEEETTNEAQVESSKTINEVDDDKVNDKCNENCEINPEDLKEEEEKVVVEEEDKSIDHVDVTKDGTEEKIDETKSTPSTTSSSSEKKAQGSGAKKESQIAYNAVIEETASKLLEKRKNKVKALVGAFETVIDYESK